MVLKIIDEKFIKDKGHKKTSHNVYYASFSIVIYRKYV